MTRSTCTLITVPQTIRAPRKWVHGHGADPDRRRARPERCILFRQFDEGAHRAAVAVGCIVKSAYGDLNRMHQFKEKSASRSPRAGTLSRPVQAADVRAIEPTRSRSATSSASTSS